MGMKDEMSKLATLFRITATQLRRLAAGPLRKNGDSLMVIEAHAYQNRTRIDHAFPRDQCLETANLLDEFAATLEALGCNPH